MDDKDAIIAFLAENWAEDHIFVRNEEIFLWQYRDPESSRLNFMLAVDDDTGAIDSLMGYIPTSRFDPALKPDGNIWGAIWKTAEGKGIVGLYVLNKLQKALGTNSYSGIGISKESVEIYKILKYAMGDMEHYYIPAGDRPLTIMSSPDTGLPEQRHPSARLERTVPERLRTLGVPSQGNPAKSPEYLYNRFANHPVYQYRFDTVFEGQAPVAVIVSRVNTVAELNASCLRIVDWYGDCFRPLDYREELARICRELRCEYVDLVCKTETDRCFTGHGFKLKDAKTETVPNYFEPFVKENIRLQYVYHGVHDAFRFFRGDADQDRPNRI
jgi:hypothetical protein